MVTFWLVLVSAGVSPVPHTNQIQIDRGSIANTVVRNVISGADACSCSSIWFLCMLVPLDKPVLLFHRTFPILNTLAMARTKQIARKAPKAPGNRADGPHHRLIAARAARSVPVEKPKKKRRYKPGTVALREIRNFQKSTEHLIRRAPFMRLVKEVAGDINPELRFQSFAILALQVRWSHKPTSLRSVAYLEPNTLLLHCILYDHLRCRTTDAMNDALGA